MAGRAVGSATPTMTASASSVAPRRLCDACTRRAISACSRTLAISKTRHALVFLASTRAFATSQTGPADEKSTTTKPSIQDDHLVEPPNLIGPERRAFWYARKSTPYYHFFRRVLPAPPPWGPFAVDVPALHREYLLLQAAAHPDKAGGDARRSAHLGLAFRTVRDPLSRAQHLLRSLHGVDPTEDEGIVGNIGGPHHNHQLADPDLLMEVLEAREAAELCEDEEEMVRLREVNNRRIEVTSARLGRALEEEDVEAAKKECVRLRYWESIRDGMGD